MKPATIILTCLLFFGCATCDPWTKEQVLLQGTSLSLNVIDWGQTLDIVDRPDEYYETNPILGKYPDRGEVNRYFACSMALKVLITHLLPSEYRKYWLGGNILVSGYYVQNNYRIGLRVNY